MIWPAIGQIPLAIASYSILLQSNYSFFDFSNIIWEIILEHVVLLVLAIMLNLAIYKSDKFAKAFRIIFFLPMVGIIGFLGVISFIPNGSFFLAVAKVFTYGLMVLAYLTVSCLPLALTKKNNPQPHIKDTIKWGAILILVFTVTNVLAFSRSISLMRTLSKEKNSFKDDLVRSEYKVIKEFDYVPHGYKVAGEDYYSGNLVLYLECIGKEEEDDYGANYVIILQYKQGQLSDSVSGGSSWVPLSDQYQTKSKTVETELLTIHDKKVKYEAVKRYKTNNYEEDRESAMDYEPTATNNIESIEARLIWENNGFVTEIQGDTTYKEETYDQTICSVDKEKMLKIAESLRYLD